MKRNRVIWAFGLGYFAFYTPYAALAKAVSAGLIPGVPRGLSGLEILPAAILGTVVAIPVILTLLGWWKYAAIPTRTVALSGFGTALIIGSTTVAYTFKGISIVLALLLMRGGLLIMGPLIDAVFGRRVRWFSWAALAVSFAALLVSLAAAKDYSLPLLAALNLATYLTGYSLRTPCMTAVAKVRDREVTYRYFVQEILVTIVVLPLIPALLAFGNSAAALALRRGFLHPPAIVPSVLIGVLYAGLYVFGTLIYLDARENTFCIPLFCGASFLAGFSAVYGLSRLFGFPAPPESQLISAAMIFGALVFLSPFHHRLEDAWDFVRGGRLRQATLATPSQLILFVCSGNTCRSPMAAAISNAELALRRNGRNGIRAESAGLTPRGSSMTEGSHAALREMSITPPPHEARPLTAEHVAAATVIYCMTESQRRALVQQFPAAAPKTHCLDPAGDIPDPIGHPQEVYSDVARRIQVLVRMRFDELGVAAV
jgi:protein-tyrosine-phosphatase